MRFAVFSHRLLLALCLVFSPCGCAAPHNGSADAAANPGASVAPEHASGYKVSEVVSGKRYMVAAAHPKATAAGAEMLRLGGTAIDAAVAIQAVLTVVEPQSSGIAGGAFMMYFDASDKELRAYDGRETAPREATADLFKRPDGEPMEFVEALVGGRSVGTPGVLRMLEVAHKKHGSLPWKKLFGPAIALCEDGFELSPRLHRQLEADDVALHDQVSRAYFFLADGKPKAIGTLLRNPLLADVFRKIAEGGADAFYKGDIARDIVAAVRSHKNPGLLSEKDLASYEPKVREPVCGKRFGWKLCGMPPPTSGGVTTLQILGMLSHIPVTQTTVMHPDTMHVLAETSRLAFADRAMYLADPDFVPVDVAGLLDDAYLKTRAGLVKPGIVMTEVRAGTPKAPLEKQASQRSVEQPSTTHWSVFGPEGDVVSMTSSVENLFGSRVMVRGFFLNNQLTDFSFSATEDGLPVANAVAPLKRPRSSMAPLIGFRGEDAAPSLALGSPGGARIIGYVTQALWSLLHFNDDPLRAISLPHVLNRNGKTEIEDHPLFRDDVEELSEALKGMGHDVEIGAQNSGIHLILRSPDGTLTGAADPRREGTALGE